MSHAPDIEVYLASLSKPEIAIAPTDPETLETCIRATETVRSSLPLDVDGLAKIFHENREFIPVIATVAGFSKERFQRWLVGTFGTAGWKTLAKDHPIKLARALDQDAGIIDLLTVESSKEWTWAEVIATIMSQRQRADSAVKSGRALEDVIETVIKELGLPFRPRTQFVGQRRATAPADFAIPDGGDEAQIVIAIKEFHSTGSKLSDAMREIEEMANVRLPTQFVFAVIDGQGWHGRKKDLQRILSLRDENRIDGVYTQAMIPELMAALKDAGEHKKLI